MDPTKTISYRRWRSKVLGKKTGPVTDTMKRNREQHAFDPQGRTLKGLKPYSYYKHLSETELAQVFKALEKEYRKCEVYRKEKVAAIKQMIQNGLYNIPGKAVVRKWFPEESEK